VNDYVVGNFVVTKHQIMEFLVPRELLSATGSNKLRFVHPQCVSPKSMGVNQDDRKLALRFRHVMISPAAKEIAEPQ
jgi:hypothetical protein